MSEEKPLPPWMKSGPPSSAEPPPFNVEGYGLQSHYRKPSGLLVFIATVNLIYALGCGCLGGFGFTAPLSVAVEMGNQAGELDRDEARKFTEQFIEQQLVNDPDFNRKLGAKSNADAERVKRGIVAAGVAASTDTIQDPSLKSLRTAAILSSAGHVFMLIGAVLLLARAKPGLWISVLGCVAVLIGMSLAIGAWGDVTRTFFDSFTSALRDPERVPDLTDVERAEFADVFKNLGLASSIFGFAAPVMTAIWPLVALVVLFASRSIKEALGEVRT